LKVSGLGLVLAVSGLGLVLKVSGLGLVLAVSKDRCVFPIDRKSQPRVSQLQ